jgi:hypothetical protein
LADFSLEVDILTVGNLEVDKTLWHHQDDARIYVRLASRPQNDWKRCRQGISSMKTLP